jgi:transposase
MKTSFNCFAGIDVSKRWLDVVIVVADQPNQFRHKRIANTPQGIDELLQWTRTTTGDKQVLYCMEHTGLYSRLAATLLIGHNCSVWMEHALQIKRSSGMLRGKNDKADAKTIARYALTHHSRAVLWTMLDDQLQHLNDLLAMRERLINAHKALVVPINEMASAGFTKAAEQLQENCAQSIAGLEKDITSTEQQIERVIGENEQWQHQVNLVKSVKGVGRVTAWFFLVFTRGFTILHDPRKLACYAGVAPFEHSSGSSIRGRTRVSVFANRLLKRLLHLGAMSAIASKGELQEFYLRKVAQGKNKMSVINAVRNKIVHRICAVIRKNQKYIPTLGV